MADQIPRREDELVLTLKISDREVIQALLEYEDGEERDAFAETALRVGVIALHRLKGQIDAEIIASERRALIEAMTGTIREYFDPERGRFNERVNQLVGNDGELASILRQQVGPEGSPLARTLEEYVGKSSPLFELLSTDESRGILRALNETVQKRLEDERTRILREFTLDDDTSALSRLVQSVKSSQREITSEFSLDREDSALSRLRRDLSVLLAEESQKNDAFRLDMAERLEAMKATRRERMRSTRHGEDFEDEVVGVVLKDAERHGDLGESTGDQTGAIRNSKVGDAVVTLGPESAAPGARIAFEAKEDKSYSVAAAHKELETARKNRRASIGVFVFSRLNAPDELDGLRRYGNDILVVWDRDDPTTDVNLLAACSVARALATEKAIDRDTVSVDLEGLDRAIRAVEKQAQQVDQITVWTETIKSNANKILERVRIAREDFDRQVSALDRLVGGIRAELDGG